MSNILEQFKFPLDAQVDLTERGLTQTTPRHMGNGVNTLEFSGFDKSGVGFRFFIKEVKAQEKSEIYDMELNDEIEMIQWFRDKKTRPTERVHMLPDGLLKFAKKKVGPDKFEFIKDEKGDFVCKGGLYAEDYRKFKAGLSSSGLPLERWEQASLAQVSTLKSEGIFTVQQFAAKSPDIVEHWPKDLKALFNDAVHYVRGKEKGVDVKPFADEVFAMKQEMAKKDREVKELKAQMAEILQATSIAPKATKKKVAKKKQKVSKTVIVGRNLGDNLVGGVE